MLGSGQQGKERRGEEAIRWKKSEKGHSVRARFASPLLSLHAPWSRSWGDVCKRISVAKRCITLPTNSWGDVLVRANKVCVCGFFCVFFFNQMCSVATKINICVQRLAYYPDCDMFSVTKLKCYCWAVKHCCVTKRRRECIVLSSGYAVHVWHNSSTNGKRQVTSVLKIIRCFRYFSDSKE